MKESSKYINTYCTGCGLCHSVQGTELKMIDATVKSGRINVEEDFTTKIDSEFYLYQPAQLKRKGTMKTTITAMKLCRRDTPKYSKSFLNKYASHVDLKVKFDFFIGIIKRVIKGRL